MSIENWCEIKCKEVGINKIPSYNRNWLETFKYNHNFEKYHIYMDSIYEIYDHIKSEGEGFYKLIKTNKDELIFMM